MPRLLVVSHCPSPNAEAMRDAVVSGAQRESAVDTVSLAAFDAETEAVLAADAIILGTTENFGYMAGALKDFFERVYYPLLERTGGLPWALFVKAGQDGQGAPRSIRPIVKGLAWREVQAPVICVGPPTQAVLDECAELGQALAAGVDAGIF